MQVGESLCNTNTDLAFLHLAIGAACKHNREEFNGVMGGLTGLSGKESSVMDADRRSVSRCHCLRLPRLTRSLIQVWEMRESRC